MASKQTTTLALTELCPICDLELHFSTDIEIGELVECTDCGTELEVKNLNPLEIIEADVEGEDWGE
ncbi:MAG TPA: hypothetical protein VJ044_12285 [Candidatus Hodarchaeales archaeon]|nr:hypothetical protein [Candidatus Hodarchaeales archaeon]